MVLNIETTPLASLINRLLSIERDQKGVFMQDYMEALGETVNSDACAALLVNRALGSVRILGGVGLHTPVEEWESQLEIPFLADQIVRSSNGYACAVTGSFDKDPFLVRERITSVLFKPATAGESSLLTAVFRRNQEAFTANEIELFNAVSGVINMSVLFQQFVKGQDVFGGMEDLADLGLFSDFHQNMVKELSRARRSGGSVTMGIMSVVSRESGSIRDVLPDVTRSFQGQLRNFDTLDRYGPRELAFILPDLKSNEGVRVVERVLRETVSSLGGQDQVPEIYVGLSCYPEDGATVERLIEMAEAAMNKALEDSRPGVFRWNENGEG